MGTMVHKLVFGILSGIIAVLAAMAIAYDKGYEKAKLICEQEKNELIIKNEIEKSQIMAKIRQKSPVERRKDLSRYVIR